MMMYGDHNEVDYEGHLTVWSPDTNLSLMIKVLNS